MTIEADGWAFPAHSDFLCDASQRFRDVLESDSEAGVVQSNARLPLAGPECSKDSVLLLLRLLYNRDKPAFAATCNMQQLRSLAELAHIQAPGWVLDLIEAALLHRAGGKDGALPDLSARCWPSAGEFSLSNIFVWAFWADGLQLRTFGNFVGRCMGANAGRLDFSQAARIAAQQETGQSSNSKLWLAAIMAYANQHADSGKGTSYSWDSRTLTWHRPLYGSALSSCKQCLSSSLAALVLIACMCWGAFRFCATVLKKCTTSSTFLHGVLFIIVVVGDLSVFFWLLDRGWAFLAFSVFFGVPCLCIWVYQWKTGHGQGHVGSEYGSSEYGYSR